MIERITTHDAWKFFGVLPRADRALAAAWWILLTLRGLLPALFAIAMGALVGAVERGDALALPLTGVGIVFVGLQVLAPIHQAVSANLGSRTAAWLYDRLTRACVAPPGMGHLESPELTSDLTMARDFDLGISGPPLAISMDFIAAGLVEMIGGLASAAVLAAYAWWAPLLLGGAWLGTHYLLRESGVWKDRNTERVRSAQRHADYAYRLAVDAPSAKELRLFGLAEWTVDRFRTRRKELHDLRWEATRLRQRSVAGSLVLVLAASAIVLLVLAADAAAGTLPLDRLVVFATAAVGTSMIAFGGLSWALDGAAAPAGAVLRLEEGMGQAGALAPGPEPALGTDPATGTEPALGTDPPTGPESATGMPRESVAFRGLGFSYPTTREPILEGFDLEIPAGSSLAIVGQNGAGKTTLAKLLCRLYDPTHGAILVDGRDLRTLDLDGWREQVTAVFQDFVRFELSLRENVAPRGAPDELVREALAAAGANADADLDTILARGYEGGTELSGGQWQRIALARTLCAVKQGARLVLLDEPTAQLDVRGEAEIFRRILAATRHVTTVLVSHRFSTVRQADRICVLEHGRVVELGSHDELMAAGGRYRTMFTLQAKRFDAAEAEGVALDVLD